MAMSVRRGIEVVVHACVYACMEFALIDDQRGLGVAGILS